MEEGPSPAMVPSQAGGTMRVLPTWMFRNVPFGSRRVGMGFGDRISQASTPGWEEAGTVFYSLPLGSQTMLHLGKDSC